MVRNNAVCGIDAIGVIGTKSALIRADPSELLDSLENGSEDIRVVV